jgi:hypothetical protein
MPKLHLATPGKFTDANGTPVEFTEETLAASAQAYDPAKHEAPIVIGHPKQTAPAYGWVKALEFAEAGLQAEPHNTVVEFAELVSGPFKKRSARFYTPTSPRNPVPGVYYLRDVGLLGAQPPAIKGLRDVEFAEGEDEVVEIEFSETSDWTLATIFRGLRDYLIEAAGMDKADRIIPEWAVEETQLAAMMPRNEPEEIMFSEGDPVTDTSITPDAGSREAELQQREAELAAREAELARAEHVAFAESLKGKLHPSQKDTVATLLCHLDSRHPTEVEFAEGEDALSQLKTLLNNLPQQVEFDEVAKATDTVDFAEDPVALANAAQAYMVEQAKAGRTVSPSEAVRVISKK